MTLHTSKDSASKPPRKKPLLALRTVTLATKTPGMPASAVIRSGSFDESETTPVDYLLHRVSRAASRRSPVAHSAAARLVLLSTTLPHG
jgi:hypothetical protein